MLQSKRFVLPLISIFMVWSGAGLPAVAQTAGLYTVSDIPVDVTAENAVSAQKQAHLEGQQDGLSRLLRRLVPAGDQARLPFSDLPVERYVRNFQIADQRLSNSAISPG